MKAIITSLLIMTFSNISMAANTIGGCYGYSNTGGVKKKLEFRGSMRVFGKVSTGAGSLYVDGRKISDFYGTDAKMRIIQRDIKASNNQGHILDVKLTNFSKKTGVLRQYSAREYGHEFKNIPINCWYK